LNEPLHRLGVAELAAAYAARETTPSRVLEHMLMRVEELDPQLRAFIEVDEPGARQAAAASEARLAGASSGTLEGVPLAIKANVDVAGLEASAGMEARRGIVATQDAAAVARLRGAGAIILGTLNMHEAALGADNDNPWFGRAINPHGAGRTPGGSSGGSAAAVAAGLCVAALGTDTLGSIRIPAAYCGVYGLKPGAGLVSQQGLEMVVEAFDTIGPLARSLDDLEAVFRAIADPQEAHAIGSISLLKDLGGVSCEAPVMDAYARAVAAVHANGLTAIERLDLELERVRLAGFITASRELGERLAELRAAQPSGFSEHLSFLLDYGARRSGEEVTEVNKVLDIARSRVREAVGDGALLLPTAPQAAFVHGSRAPVNQADFTALASVAGLPALAIPAGLDPHGLPVSVQLVGGFGNELGLIDLARRLEHQLGGFVPPPIF